MACIHCKNQDIHYIENNWFVYKNGSLSQAIFDCHFCGKNLRCKPAERYWSDIEDIIKPPKPSRPRRKGKKIADIIIPHHNRHDMLFKCLESLPNDIFNIIIVSGKTFAENANKGAKMATTDNLIILNDDVIVEDGVIEAMIEQPEDIVGVPLRIVSSGKVVYGMNMIWGKHGVSKVLDGFESVKTMLEFHDKPHIPVTGAVFLIRKKVWKDLGGFNEVYKNGGEDNHLFLEAIERGYTFGKVDTICDHYHSSSEGRYDYDIENHKILTQNFPKERFEKIMGEVKQELVSIIIPTKYPKKEPACLKSIKAQTYQNIETIIIRDKELKGANWARNKGFKKAVGKYVFFCDDDIKLDKRIIDEMVKRIEGTNASFVYCAYDRKGALTGKHTPIDWDYNVLKNHNYISTMSLIKAEDFTGFDESLERFQDWDLWLTMAEKGKVGTYLPHCLFTATYKNGDISTKDNLFETEKIIKDKHSL